MKCRDVKLWLLSSRANDPLPAALRRHLEGCVRCRAKRQTLSRLDERVRALPLAPTTAAANEEFRRRTKTQASLPSQDAVLLLLFGLMRSGQIRLRRLDGWQEMHAVKEAA